MNNYVGCVCSVCNKPFAAGDDIVVCPECGTPYHRACYQAAGGCVHEAQHAEGYAWQPPQQHAQQAGGPQGQPAGGAPRVCPACGVQNRPGALFCENCGTPLSARAGQRAPGGAWGPAGANPYAHAGGPAPGYGQPGAGARPGWGAAAQPAASYDGISASEWQAYIGPSTPYYLYQFSRMDAAGRKFGFSFSAFFFAPLYFLYRKMYSWAALALAAGIVTSIPGFLAMFRLMDLPLGYVLPLNVLSALSQVGGLAGLAVQVLFAMFAVYLYRRHAAKKIRAVQSEGLAPRDYAARLTRTGGTSVLAVVLALVAYLALCYAFGLWVSPERLMQLASAYGLTGLTGYGYGAQGGTSL